MARRTTRFNAAAAVVIAAAVVAGAGAGSASARPAAAELTAVPRPSIVWRPIPYDAKRRSDMRGYAVRHYRIDTWRLVQPKVIVQHYTAGGTFASAYATFAANVPDGELGELPGVCAHFVIDRDGTIYQLVRLNTMCRHTVGLNYTAIGIEHVGFSDAEILRNRRQLDASLALTIWLMATRQIQLRNVIGHNESRESPFHKELSARWRCQTHGDWTRESMEVYRRALTRLARKYAVPIGPRMVRRKSGC